MSGAPTPEFQLKFLDYIQRLLDGGEFVATYKYALLMALADVSVEMGDDSDAPLPLDASDLATKFVQYYARQAVPYPAGEKAGLLLQSTGSQARIVSLVAERQTQYEANGQRVTLATLTGTRGLITDVARTIATMPLWKLQLVGGHLDDFLYPQIGSGRSLELKPGIAYCFRRFHTFVIRLAQDGWIRHVRGIGANRELLGDVIDLAAFMFGASRAQLADYRNILAELQGRRCFYCGHERKHTEVDHFIPWSWYSLDLGHNFVLACRECNGHKSDSLASVHHLAKWAERNQSSREYLDVAFCARGLPHDLEATSVIATWAYHRAASSRIPTWAHGRDYEELPARWRDLLSLN